MSDPTSTYAAVAIFFAATLAILAFTFFWAAGNRRPAVVHAHLTGRRATPYWHSPSGLADERGISARIVRVP